MIDLHFLVGFIIGAIVALMLGARFVVRRLRALGVMPPRETSTVFDESQVWRKWPI